MQAPSSRSPSLALLLSRRLARSLKNGRLDTNPQWVPGPVRAHTAPAAWLKAGPRKVSSSRAARGLPHPRRAAAPP